MLVGLVDFDRKLLEKTSTVIVQFSELTEKCSSRDAFRWSTADSCLSVVCVCVLQEVCGGQRGVGWLGWRFLDSMLSTVTGTVWREALLRATEASVKILYKSAIYWYCFFANAMSINFPAKMRRSRNHT